MLKPNSHQSGLTLIELIIALSLFSMIAATAYSGLMQILRAQRNITDQRDAQMLANSVIGRISRELQMATTATRLLPPAANSKKVYPPTVNMLSGESSGNSSSSLSFVADDAGQYIPDGKTHTGTVQITYRVEEISAEENPNQEEVFYLIRDELPIIKPLEKAYKSRMTFPVTSRLVSLKFRFYDLNQKRWVKEWTEQQAGLPGSVGFSIQIRSPLGKLHSFTSDIALRSGS